MTSDGGLKDKAERVGLEAELLYERHVPKSVREKIERAPSAAREVAENVSRGAARVKEKRDFERTRRSDEGERQKDRLNTDRRAAEKQATRAARDKAELDMLDDVNGKVPSKEHISAVVDGSYRKPPSHGQEAPPQPAPRPDSSGRGRMLGRGSAPRWAIGRGVSSDVLPGMGRQNFGGSPLNFSNGTSIPHAYTRGSAIEFGRGTAVDVARMVGFSGSGLGISAGRGLPFNVGSGLGFGGRLGFDSGLARLGAAKFGMSDGRLEMFKPLLRRR